MDGYSLPSAVRKLGSLNDGRLNIFLVVVVQTDYLDCGETDAMMLPYGLCADRMLRPIRRHYMNKAYRASLQSGTMDQCIENA